MLREACRKLGIDAIIAIGGDGTLTIARDLCGLGIPIVGVPKTIDNDLSATEVAFGFDTALHVPTEHDEPPEHHGGIASATVVVMECRPGCGMDRAALPESPEARSVILIPEIPFTIETICERLRERTATGKKFSLVVVAEVANLLSRDPSGNPFPAPRPGRVGIVVGEPIHTHLKQDVRVTVLGHLGAGADRPARLTTLLATRFGVEAVELVSRRSEDEWFASGPVKLSRSLSTKRSAKHG